MSAHGDDARRPDVAEWPGEPDEARRSLLDLSVAAAGIGSFDWDLVTGTLSWDVRLIELFGYDAATFDRSIDAFNARLHPDDVDRVGVLLGRAIETVGEYSAEYRVVLPDGQQRWVAARGRALADESGAAVRLLGAAWDISVRRGAGPSPRTGRGLSSSSWRAARSRRARTADRDLVAPTHSPHSGDAARATSTTASWGLPLPPPGRRRGRSRSPRPPGAAGPARCARRRNVLMAVGGRARYVLRRSTTTTRGSSPTASRSGPVVAGPAAPDETRA